MEEVNQKQTIQEQVSAEQVESKPSFLKKFRKVGVILFSFLIFLIFVYMFLATPRETQGKPIKPFYYGQRMFAEKVSYLFTDPKEGDRVLFKTDDTRMDFFGVITAIENKNNILTYKIVSSDPINPWIVTRDKIIGKIYYPFMKNEQVLKIISSQLPTPTPSPNLNSAEMWENYTNGKYGFLFKYPNNIEVEELENDKSVPSLLQVLSMGTGNSSITVNIWASLGIKISNLSDRDKWCELIQKELIGQLGCQHSNSLQKITFNNYPAFIATGEGISASTAKTIYVYNENFVFQIISSQITDTSSSLNDQILSTFKFIDQNTSIDTLNWKTYRSLKHKYSFNFPSGWRIEESSDPIYFTIYSFAEDKYIGQRGPIPSENLQLEAYIKNDINKSLDEWVKFDGEIIKTENINIDSVSAKKVWKEDNRGDQVLSVYYKSGTKGVIFYSWPHDTVYSKEFDEIVKSFKFTE